MKNRTLNWLYTLAIASACAYIGPLHAQPAISNTGANDVSAQAARLAHLLGSYLTQIASQDSTTGSFDKATYKQLALGLFHEDAQIQVSRLGGKTVSYPVHEYINEHFEKLVARTGYTYIRLEWRVESAVAEGNEVTCEIVQDFEGINEKNRKRKYSDQTTKEVPIHLEANIGPSVGGDFKFTSMQIGSIRVLGTAPLGGSGSSASSSSPTPPQGGK